MNNKEINKLNGEEEFNNVKGQNSGRLGSERTTKILSLDRKDLLNKYGRIKTIRIITKALKKFCHSCKVLCETRANASLGFDVDVLCESCQDHVWKQYERLKK